MSATKPLWQQVTAMVSLGASGTITGFSFVPAATADLASPASMPIRLMALERSAQPATTDDARLRSAIVNVAQYYLRLAQEKTPAEMEAIIWQHDSLDGVDHGASCAAFASLTLELAAHVVGQQSWVTGGGSYPWPLHTWADVRVDPNPASLNIISVLQDAQANGRWHPLGDGYQPQPGDWVLFNGHVEVVTQYSDGVLDTVGGDSLPNFSVNAHQYASSLAADGVVGFVNNGNVPPAAATATADHGHAGGFHHERGQASPAAAGAQATDTADPTIPGTPAAGASAPDDAAAIPGMAAAKQRPAGRRPAAADPPAADPPPAPAPRRAAAPAPRQTAGPATATADVPGTTGPTVGSAPAAAKHAAAAPTSAGAARIPGLPGSGTGPAAGASGAAAPTRGRCTPGPTCASTPIRRR